MEQEVLQTEKKGRGAWWKWVLTSILSGLLIGAIVGTSVGMAKVSEIQEGLYLIAENGYSGNSIQNMVPVIQNDPRIATVSEKLQGAVVTIVVQQSIGIGGIISTVTESLGSGVVFREDDQFYYIVTNAHVIEDGTNIFLYYAKEAYGEEARLKVEVVGADGQSDLAVLRLERSTVPQVILERINIVEFADSDALRIGETAVAIGSPQDVNFYNSVTVGVVSGTHREVEVEDIAMTYIQTDAAINPGNSGGALVNLDGKLIGINSAKISDDQIEGIGLAIPSNTVREVVDELMDKGYVEWISLGLQEYDFLSEVLAEAYGVPTGVVVYSVVQGGPADRAGLQRGDIITKIAGENVETMERFQELLDSHEPGTTVELTVIRGRDAENPLTVKATLMTESQLEDLRDKESSGFWG